MRTEHRAIETSMEVFTMNRARRVYHRRVEVSSMSSNNVTQVDDNIVHIAMPQGMVPAWGDP